MFVAGRDMFPNMSFYANINSFGPHYKPSKCLMEFTQPCIGLCMWGYSKKICILEKTNEICSLRRMTCCFCSQFCKTDT